MRVSSWLWPLALVAFIGLPIAEIWVLIKAGHWLGLWPTLGLLFGVAVLGTWLARHEGLRAWRAIQDAAQRGQMPDRELVDGLLVLVGAVLLVLPGFLTDVVALVCLLPFTRFLPRMLISSAVGSRMVGVAPSRRARHGDVIPGEVVEESGDGRAGARDQSEPGEEPPALEGRVL